MESIPFFLIIRLLLGFAAGFWLARKVRGSLRWLVVRLMPVRYRVSEQSFNMQARFSAALAYLLALGVALFIYIGLGKARDKLAPPRVTIEEVTEISPSSMGPTLETSSGTPVYSSTSEAPPRRDSLPAVALEPQRPAPGPPPAYPSSYEENGRYFVQIFAFKEEARAWAQKQYWESRLSRRVWVGVATGEAVPYKVLVGPFGQRQDARRYLRSEGLAGFPREQEDIRLYKD